MHTMSKYKYFFGVKMALKHLNIFVATMTGTALMVAEDISDFCSDNNIDARVKEMDNLRIEKLIIMEILTSGCMKLWKNIQ